MRIRAALVLVFLVLFLPFGRALDGNHDGIDDLWQQRYGIGPFQGGLDPDGDGFINLVESLTWSDPHNAGSGWQILAFTDINPQDGYEDSWQHFYKFLVVPSNPLTQLHADYDGDGRTNLEESIVGSDPRLPDSPPGPQAPPLAAPPADPFTFTLSLPRTDPTTRYQLETSEDLTMWSSVSGGTFYGDGGPWEISEDIEGYTQKFYRFIIDQPDDDADGLLNWHEWILGTSAYTADTDGDGLGDGWEAANGLNALGSDTDGDGADDGAEVGANTDPNSNLSHPPIWRTIERTLQYDFDDYPPDDGGRHGTLTTSASWDASIGGTTALTSEIAWPALSARLNTDIPFPQNAPPSSGTEIISQSSANLQPNPPCYHARLNHRRVWLEVKPAPAEPITMELSMLTVRRIDGQEPTGTTQTITATIPAGQTISGYSDLTPTFTSNPSDNTLHTEEIDFAPFGINCPELYLFSGHKNDVAKLTKLRGLPCEWKLKNAAPVVGTFDRPGDTASRFIATTPGTNTIQLRIGGNLVWEKPVEIINIIARAAWGAAAPKPHTQTMGWIESVTLHHTSNSNSGAAEMQRIQKLHMSLPPYNLPFPPFRGKDFDDIGYHLVMDKDGNVYEGRQIESAPGKLDGPYSKGEHVAANNTVAGFGLCTMGDYEGTEGNEAWPPARQKALEKVISAVCRRHHLSFRRISLHKSMAKPESPSSCPGSNFIVTILNIVANVRTNLQ